MRIRIILYCFVLLAHCISWADDTNSAEINNFVFSVNSNVPEANENIINSLKNYFSRFEKVNEKKIRDILGDSKSSVRHALEPYGYFSPNIQLKYYKSNKKYNLIYSVNGGNIATVTGVEIALPESIIKKAKLNKELKLLYDLNHKPYDGVALAEIKFNLLEKIRHCGYPFVDFNQAMMQFSNPTKVVLKLGLHLNKYYTFGLVTIKGNKSLDPKFIRRFADFKQGDPFDSVKVHKFQKDLMNTGYFNEVSVHPINWGQDSREVHLTVDVQDTKKWHSSYTVGYDDIYHLGGSVAYQVKPFNKAGHSLEFLLRASTNKFLQFQTNYLVPSLKPLERFYVFTSQVLTQDLSQGKADSALLAFAIHQKFKDLLLVPSLNMFIEDSMPDDKSEYTTEMLYPQLNISYKVKDPYPWINKLAIDGSGMISEKSIMSGISMNRLTLRGECVVPLSDLFRIRLWGTLGMLSSSDLDDVPLSMYFYTGGPESVRGYSYNTMGPGRYEKNVSFELQYPITDLFETFVFLDQGMASDHWHVSMDAGTGLGVALNFRLVGLKLSLARALDGDEDPFKIQFSVQSTG